MFHHLIKTNKHQKLQVVFCLYFLSHQGGGASQKVSLPSSPWHTLVKGPNVKKGCELTGSLSHLLNKQASTQLAMKLNGAFLTIWKLQNVFSNVTSSFQVGPTVPEPNPEAKLWLIAEHVSSAAHLRKDD